MVYRASTDLSWQGNKGRLSEAGLERLARKIGLECLWETHMGSGSGSRTLIIAGSALALDIDFNNNEVQKVSLAFPDSPDIVTRHTEKAGAILLEDLQIKPTESPLTKMLDRFAANLERLALLDKLSVIPSLNCYEAIAGLYESLERLHKWEAERLSESQEFGGKGPDFSVRAAMCTKSGKPMMHARDRLGLSLDYWEEKRRIPKKSSTQQGGKTWSLLIECAPIPFSMIESGLSLRVSSEWISSEIEQVVPAGEEMFLPPGGEPILDWQNPKYTMLPSTDLPRPDVMDGVGQPTGQKYPEVMFLAKFDPPIVIPFGLANHFMYNCTNSHFDDYQATRIDELLLPHKPGEKIENEETSRKISQDVLVPVFSKDGETTQRHKNTLYVEKIDFGKTLTEMPFIHPTQLIGLLSTLRQYAFLSTILGKSFGSTAVAAPKLETEQPSLTRHEELQAIIDGKPLPNAQGQALPVDVTFTSPPTDLPSVRLGVTFPLRARTANVNFDIGPNAVVKVISENIIKPMNESEGKKVSAEDLARMLEITEDLGIWVEFVRRRLV